MKLQLPSLFKIKETKQEQYPWNQWPSCKQPKTLSFRISGDDNKFKTVNSIYFDDINNIDSVETPESSWFTNSSESAVSYSSDSEDVFNGESLEMVVRGARSERLFFEPEDTNSILEIKGKVKKAGDHDEFNPFKESVVLALESENPYEDFKMSMKEMVESHGLKDWDCLEELLGWYLRVNGKKNHGFIVSAFVDLLVSLSGTNNACADHNISSTSSCYSSVISSFSSSPVCSISHDSIFLACKKCY